MKIRPSTEENHSCKYIYGKAWALAKDKNKQYYCAYCFGKLLDSQIHVKAKR
ncbi:MAG: hypothetical protein AABX11_01350 [Nanoarchaeota archaeon]